MILIGSRFLFRNARQSAWSWLRRARWLLVSRPVAVRKVFCNKLNSWSQQGATRDRAAASNTATIIIRHLRCQSCASHAHVDDLAGDNVARNAMYSSPVHLAAVLSYADQRDVSVTDPRRPIAALRGEASFSRELSAKLETIISFWTSKTRTRNLNDKR